jgi:hypothetical protein
LLLVGGVLGEEVGRGQEERRRRRMRREEEEQKMEE